MFNFFNSKVEFYDLLKAMRIARKDSSVDMIVNLKKDRARLLAVRGLAKAGEIVPVIDRIYPFEEAAAAIDYVATKRARGKVIVEIETQESHWNHCDRHTLSDQAIF